MLLAPLVVIHLIMIIIAVRNGLTAEEILSRTQNNVSWFIFYLLFVCAVSIHAPIGVRNILREWTALKPGVINGVCVITALALFVTGSRALMAVT